MTALIPEIDAWRNGRPVSAARIWVRAMCWAELPERRYERLFVVTTTTSAPRRTKSRTSGANADSKQMTRRQPVALDPKIVRSFPGV